jgi:hypothetical protein
VDPNQTPKNDGPAKRSEPRTLEEANENIRKSEDDEPTPRDDSKSAEDSKRSGHKPAFDRDR